MEVLSVNVGQIEEIPWRGRVYRSAIRKRPVHGPLDVEVLGLDGDAQADLEAHGGPDKAVYAYPHEHYGFWADTLSGGHELPFGALGENLTTTGLLEDGVAVGDILEMGTALLQATQPRMPCVKLAACYGRAGLPRAFMAAGRPGIYFRVIRAGSIEAGHPIRIIRRSVERWSIARVFHALNSSDHDPGEVVRMAGLDTLGAGARKDLQERTSFRGSIRPAEPHDIQVLLTLLRDHGLPTDGVAEDAAVILVAVDTNGELLAGVAVEVWGGAALLRSLIVRRDARGRGLGQGLVRAAMAQATGRGASAVGLLTEGAGGLFERLGFRGVSRDALPDSLARSRELQGACPDTADAFVVQVGAPG